VGVGTAIRERNNASANTGALKLRFCHGLSVGYPTGLEYRQKTALRLYGPLAGPKFVEHTNKKYKYQ
jgi:hypothetical protein